MSDLNKIIDELSKLTVVEAAELSKQLEEKWGHSCSPSCSGASWWSGAPAAQEKSEFHFF